MRVGWDLTDLAPNKDGTFELLSRWLECVAAYPAGHAHICFANAGFRRLANHPVLDRLDWRICGNWPNRLQLRREGYFWRCGESLRREVDVLISVYRPPFAWRGKSITIVLDCTKELFPTVRGFKNHVMARLRDIGARRSGRWLAISEWTRRDVVRLRGYPADRVRSAGIPLADLEALPSAAAPAAIPQELAERRYAFYCSAISGRKNHERLIRAWRRAFPNREVLLVLAGRELPGIPAGIGETIRQAERDGFVRRLGLISDSAREQLYAGADFVVYPSLCEGFGMPILEALRYAKPILTSAGTSTEEVGGEAVLLCNPRDETDLAEKLVRIATDETLRAQLRAHIPAVLARYSRENVARQIHEAIGYLAALGEARS